MRSPSDRCSSPSTTSRHWRTSRTPSSATALTTHPRWTHYVIGVALVLVRHGVIEAPRVHLSVSSEVPQSVGVSSSAALEVATARALGAGAIDALQLASLCQEAENQVVGAPCGIMDQVVVTMGRTGAVLPILCRPASVLPPAPLPEGIEVVGRPTGAEHDVSGAPYRRARAAAFMGKRIIERGRGAGVVLGERGAGVGGRRAPRTARGCGVPRTVGHHSTTSSRPSTPERPIRCGRPRGSGSRSTGAARQHSPRSNGATPRHSVR